MKTQMAMMMILHISPSFKAILVIVRIGSTPFFAPVLGSQDNEEFPMARATCSEP